MSKFQFDQRRTHPSARLAIKLSKQRVEETKRLIEESRKLLEQPIYPYDPRTAPKLKK